MATMTLDTVYESYAQRQENAGNEERPGSLEIVGGEVNLYWSNDDAAPANAAAMTLDDASPLTGQVAIKQGARWVLVELASGAPVVDEYRVAIVPGV